MKKDTEMTTRERELYDLCTQIIEIGEKIVARGGGDIRFERKITGIDDTPKEEGRLVWVGDDPYWEYTDRKGSKSRKKNEPEDPRRCKDCKLFEWALRVQTRKEDGHCKQNKSMRYHGDYICLHFEKK